jgi:hypothetical protein
MRKGSVIQSRLPGVWSGRLAGLSGRNTPPELPFTQLSFAGTPDLVAASPFVAPVGCHAVSPVVAACGGNWPRRGQKPVCTASRTRIGHAHLVRRSEHSQSYYLESAHFSG